jgi:mercuric ion transport protein
MSRAFERRGLVNLSKREMKSKSALAVGVTGTLITAICCFTPALVVTLAAVGLSAWLAWLDYILLPALALFVGVSVVAL